MASRPETPHDAAGTQVRAKPLPFGASAGRSAGVLLHVTSLPGPYGIGDLGPAAHAWIDRLAAARQSWWQMLPLGPAAGGHSPYQCYSAFAGNPLLISPEALVADGLLTTDDITPPRTTPGRVAYGAAGRFKQRLLRQAWTNFKKGTNLALRPAFEAFRKLEQSWLPDYALFTALHAANGGRPWFEWPTPLMRRRQAALAAAASDLADAIDAVCFAQFLFARQLSALRAHAYHRGVGLIGDLPIFVAADSADVWTHPQLFQLDRQLRPKAVAGVPPDMFSATGQRWNNPLYDWQAMARDGYAWWTARLASAFAQADAVRLDHFRGFDAYWRIPANAPTAETGRWTDGPGRLLFDVARERLGPLPLVAEDLGVITPRVRALQTQLGLPGMRVMQFGFGATPDSIHLPHHFTADCVAYPGTHDNDTAAGWHASLDRHQKGRFDTYAAARPGESPATILIRLAWASVAALAIVPLQDVLNLPTSARMNRPGTATGNWRWRLADFDATIAGMDELLRMTVVYARV